MESSLPFLLLPPTRISHGWMNKVEAWNSWTSSDQNAPEEILHNICAEL